MSTKRIYEIAKELGLKSKDVQDKLEQMGVETKSASSSITTDQYEAFRQRHAKLFADAVPEQTAPITGKERVISVVRDEEGQVAEKVTEKRISRGVIRRRARVESIPEEERHGPAASEPEVAASAAGEPTAPAETAASAATQQPVETAPPQFPATGEPESPLLKIVEPERPDFKPRVEQPAAPPPSGAEAEAGRDEAGKGGAVRERTAKDERDDRRRADRRVLKEQLADRDWRETKRMLAKRRGFDDVGVVAGGGPARRGRRKRAAVGGKKGAPGTAAPAKKKPIRIEETIPIVEMAGAMGIKSAELVKSLMNMGVMATANQAVDFETATLLATEFGYETERVGIQEEEILRKRAEVNEESLTPRPPVVTIMGHVDHGKTSLLDKIRTTRVAEGEAGGITQHIGAYHVDTAKGPVTFLDTPGHAAFTAMRARGAQATDIVVLVVAADDGVKPQTIEAINHAKAAGVPIVVAVNKVDKPDAKPERVRQQLSDYELAPEEWGGQTLFVDVSAKTGQGIDDLLENLALQAEILELKASPEHPASGIVVEARLEKGRGPVATVLIQNGTLHQGDYMVAGQFAGRARALTDDLGRRVDAVGPGLPVELLGLSGVPQAGDPFDAAEDEKLAKQVAEKRAHKFREADLAASSRVSLEQLFKQIEQGEAKELPIVIKADVQGSVEAVTEALQQLSTPACRVKIIHTGAGGITESDVMLAAASNAIIIGFNVRPDRSATDTAERQKVEVRTYSIIYEAIDDVRAAMEGLLEPEKRENVIGRVEIREVYNISKVGKVAGCYVQDGKVTRNAHVRVVRDGTQVYDGTLSSLKRFKDDVKEVPAGMECGLSIADFADVKVGDVLEVYEIEEVAVKLEDTRTSESTGDEAPSQPA